MKYAVLALILCCFLAACHKTGDDNSNTSCRLSSTPYYFSQGGAVVELPNAFTPNGDGRNDYFRAIGVTNLSTFGLAVFDHSGNIIFQTTDPYAGWDGRQNGSLVSPGYYSVQLQFTTVNGDHVERQECVAVAAYGNQGCIQRSSYGSYYFEDMFDATQPGVYPYASGESVCP